LPNAVDEGVRVLAIGLVGRFAHGQHAPVAGFDHVVRADNRRAAVDGVGGCQQFVGGERAGHLRHLQLRRLLCAVARLQLCRVTRVDASVVQVGGDQVVQLDDLILEVILPRRV